MNSQETTDLQQTDSIDNFVSLIAQAGTRLQEAAAMLVRLTAKDPQTCAKIREINPSIPAGLLTNLLRVGERSLHADLLLNNCLAYQRIRSLPYSMQEEVLRARAIDLVIDAEKGDALRVPLTELNGEQVAQVFSKEGVRSKDDQRAYIRRKQAVPKVSSTDLPAWFVKKDQLHIPPHVFSRSQVLAWLGEMGA